MENFISDVRFFDNETCFISYLCNVSCNDWSNSFMNSSIDVRCNELAMDYLQQNQWKMTSLVFLVPWWDPFNIGSPFLSSEAKSTRRNKLEVHECLHLIFPRSRPLCTIIGQVEHKCDSAWLHANTASWITKVQYQAYCVAHFHEYYEATGRVDSGTGWGSLSQSQV